MLHLCALKCFVYIFVDSSAFFILYTIVWLKLLMKILFEELHDQGDAERMHIPIVDSLQINQRLHTMQRYCWIRARKIDKDLKQNSICFIL